MLPTRILLSRVKWLTTTIRITSGAQKLNTIGCIATERVIPTINHIPVAKIHLSTNYLNHSTAHFDDVKNVPNTKNVLLIDVREPSELQQTGIIPGSINIPLGQVETVLRDTSPSEFLKKYGREKPTSETPIIFSCLLGKRSGDAQGIAQKLGYNNVKNYVGGWQEWSEKNK